MKYISPISIDLGALNTGVVFTHYKEGEEPLSHFGSTFVLDSKNFTASQKQRLSERHRMRGEQRKKLAKRLFFVLLKTVYGLEEENTETWIFIRGLLNRRGFTYISEDSESDLEIEDIPIDYLRELFPGEFSKIKKDPLVYIRELASENEEDAIRLWKKLSSANYKSLHETAKGNLPDEIIANFKNYSKTIIDLSTSLLNEIERGNKPRKKYLEEIKKDISSNKELQKLLKKAKNPIKVTEFYNLIGNISNIQLRCLRKYFNDPKMSNGKDYWNEKRFLKIYSRYIKSWHTERDSIYRKNQSFILRSLEKEKLGLLNLFLSNDPIVSIPPFEDQNNRRIPACNNLLLSPEKLNKSFKGWKEIVKKLNSNNKFSYSENIDDIVVQFKSSNNQSVTKESLILQRILDRSKSLDSFALRDNSKFLDKSPEEINKSFSKKELETISNKKILLSAYLTPTQEKELLSFANKYYNEISEAKSGLWNQDDTFFIKCNCKPRHRVKMKQEVVEQILHYRFKEGGFDRFINEIWLKKIKGNSTIKSLSGKIETDRKQLGNFFKPAINSCKHKNYISLKNNIPLKNLKLSDEEKIAQKALENSEIISNEIGSYLNHSFSVIQKFNNPFSIAQLYNIIELEPHGFFKTCPACQMENSWRAELSDESANAVSLTADTGRPFDGQIDRILNRLAREITYSKSNQIMHHFKNGDDLYIPIFMESNQFSFTEEVYKFKGREVKKKSKDQLQKQIKKFEDRLYTKTERIIKDSQNICPYTGDTIGKNGEIDHIIPRSSTKEFRGTVYNSEMNLIYTSQKGNQLKGNRSYSLSNLHDKFLKKIFSTTDLNMIRNDISSTIDILSNEMIEAKRKYIIPDRLTESDRIKLKLALFDSKLRSRVIPFLSNQTKSIVNGTQIWFFKNLKVQLYNQFSKKYPNSEIYFSFFPISVDNLDYRRLLAAYNPKYLKLKEQTEGSHILDASLVFAAGLDLSAQGKINLKSPLIHLDEKPNGEWLESLLPDSIRLQPIKRTLKYRKSDKSSTSLFKATMYAERFLSLLVNTKGVRFGFTEERCTEYIKKDIEEELFENLRTFLFYREESLENYSLAQFRSKFLESGTIVLKLDRQKVKEYLQTSRLNDQLSILLESIRYTTQNKKILDEKNEFSLTKEKLISQKTKFEIYFKGKKLLTTSINMPYVDEWINIIKLFTKVKPEERHKSIYNYLREDRIENQYLHHSKRQKLSLPYEAGPSGGMRIQRQTPFGESVFQVQTGETSNIGFALDSDGKVDFSSPILDPIYTSGKVNTFKNSDRIRNEEYVYLDEWRKLQINEDQENNGIIEIQMSPATKARATLRVKISLQQFKKINHLTERESLKPILYSTKLYGKKDTEQFSKLSKFLDKYIEKQRDYITILDISDDGVTIEYVTDGFPSNLKTLYNLSKKTKKG